MKRYEEVFNAVIKYSQDNPVIAAIVGIILLVFLIKRPKLFFLLLFFVIAGIGVVELFEKLSAMMAAHQKSPFTEH
jgi:membrane protein implicated in regulation of membrane protease activity